MPTEGPAGPDGRCTSLKVFTGGDRGLWETRCLRPADHEGDHEGAAVSVDVPNPAYLVWSEGEADGASWREDTRAWRSELSPEVEQAPAETFVYAPRLGDDPSRWTEAVLRAISEHGAHNEQRLAAHVLELRDVPLGGWAESVRRLDKAMPLAELGTEVDLDRPLRHPGETRAPDPGLPSALEHVETAARLAEQARREVDAYVTELRTDTTDPDRWAPMRIEVLTKVACLYVAVGEALARLGAQ